VERGERPSTIALTGHFFVRRCDLSSAENCFVG
jgi:hypothetical protein